MIDIRTIERDGQYYVELAMDGQPMNTHGPFPTDNEAEIMAARFAAACHDLHQPVQLQAAVPHRGRHRHP